MTTTYTDAQIEAKVKQLSHDCWYEAADMLRSLLAERQAASRGQSGEAVSDAADSEYSHDGAKATLDALTAWQEKGAPQPVRSVSDEVRGWDARALDRCCTELTNLINLADDYEFDEVTVQTFQTSIECIRVCKQAANGQEKQS